MEFDGTFTIDDVSAEEVWLALSDPYMIKQSLPGCQFLTRVDDPDDVDFEALREETGEDPPLLPEADPEDVADRGFEAGEHYAALVEIGVGAVNPSFKTIVTIDEWDYPTGSASGEGDASGSAFEMDSGMSLTENDDGSVDIDWHAEADVFGRIAQMGQRVINPVADRVVSRFFQNIESQLTAVADEADESGGLGDRIRDIL